jgi:hypothetical protein
VAVIVSCSSCLCIVALTGPPVVHQYHDLQSITTSAKTRARHSSLVANLDHDLANFCLIL